MNKRLIVILASGAAVLLVAYIALHILVKRSLPNFPESTRYFASSFAPDRSSGLAPVQLWWEAPQGEKSYWRAKKSARLLLVKGEAFVGDERLPRERIKA